MAKLCCFIFLFSISMTYFYRTRSVNVLVVGAEPHISYIVDLCTFSSALTIISWIFISYNLYTHCRRNLKAVLLLFTRQYAARWTNGFHCFPLIFCGHFFELLCCCFQDFPSPLKGCLYCCRYWGSPKNDDASPYFSVVPFWHNLVSTRLWGLLLGELIEAAKFLGVLFCFC